MKTKEERHYNKILTCINCLKADKNYNIICDDGARVNNKLTPVLINNIFENVLEPINKRELNLIKSIGEAGALC